MIFSQGYELFVTCDVCGRKYVYRNFAGVRAGHQTVCMNPKCIVDAMHETWVPRLAIGDEDVNDIISKYSKRPISVVNFHTDIARGVYQVFNNPSIINLPDTILLEAIVATEFAQCNKSDAIEYAQTIDVMYKPLWVPTGRKCIDTNYPFASVVAGTAGGFVMAGVLYENGRNVNSIGEPKGRCPIYNCDPIQIANISGLHILGCPTIPVSKGAIVLGQLYLRSQGEYETIFDSEDKFTKFAKMGLYSKKMSKTGGHKLYDTIMQIVKDDDTTYFEKQDHIINVFNDVESDINYL